MAQDSAYWDGTTVGDAASTDLWSAPYSSLEFSDVFSKILGSSAAKGYILPEYNNGLRVTANSPAAMNVLVNSGAIFLRGKVYENTASATLTITSADVTNPRLDRIVARITFASQTVRLAVLAGTPAATPSLPSLTQNATTYEIEIANIWVAANATTITDVDIHDQREFSVNFREAAYKTSINQIRNSEFLGNIQSRIYAPAEWDLVVSPSAIATATKPAQMVRGNYVQITSDAASEGISQTIPCLPSTPYAIKALISVTAGDQGQIIVTDNGGTPVSVTRTIKRTGVDLEERIFLTTASDATTLTVKFLCVNSTDVIKVGQCLVLPGFNAGPFRVCNYDDDVILIDKFILTATQANLDFQSIPSGYKAIKIVASLRTSTAANAENITFRINNDSGANYDSILGLVVAASSLSTVQVVAGTSATLAQVPANTGPANAFGGLEIIIPDYDNASRHKAGMMNGSSKSANSSGNIKTERGAFFWRSTAAITRITLISSSSFAVGSMIEVYLIR